MEKNLHGDAATRLQSVDYTYNIRGWLTQMNNADLDDGENDLFGFELKYDEAATVANEPAQFNGNIAAMVWRSASDNVKRGYGYTYDWLNQLTSANYGAGDNFGTDVNLYEVSGLFYDLNGNIKQVNRWGNVNGIRTRVDGLEYTYRGNQLLRVVDDRGVSYGDDFGDGNIKQVNRWGNVNGARTRVDGLEYAYRGNQLLRVVDQKVINDRQTCLVYDFTWI